MGRVFFNTRENLDTTSLTGTDTYVMLASDSGKTFLVSGGTQTVTLLPAADMIEGWRCRFVTTASPSGDKTIGAGSAVIHGTHVATPTESDNGAGTDGTAVSNIIIEAASQAGNWMEIVCDGSAYYFFAAASQDAAFSTS
jgi:hypothetical protein